MRLLGPSVLRIGGDSVDVSWWTSRGEAPPPWAANTVTPADISALSGLLAATGWRVLLGVDLGHFEPARIGDEARHARAILHHRLLGIEIGNEPDDFPRRAMLRPTGYDAPEYQREATSYRRQIASAGVAVYGPALARTEWLPQLHAFDRTLTALTLHYYPGATCVPPGSPVAGGLPAGGELLEPTVREEEDQMLAALTRAGALAGRPTRIGETNASACAGSPSQAPLYASALWSLDFSLRAASDGVGGVSFHGSLGVCEAFPESPICATTQTAARAGALVAQPEFYGLLAARRLEGGRFIPIQVSGAPLPADVTTWATLAPDGTIRVVIDDLAVAGAPQQLSLSAAGDTITAQTLTGTLGAGARSVSLGGATVNPDGTWHPHRVALESQAGLLHVVLAPASAIVLTLQPHGDR